MMTKKEFMNYEAPRVSEILSRSGMEDISVQLVNVAKMLYDGEKQNCVGA